MIPECGARLIAVLALFGAQAACVGSQPPSKSCVVELPVYDATGNRAVYKVVGVEYREGEKSLDLLSAAAGAHRVRATGNRIGFPSVWLRRDIFVTMSDGKGEKFWAKVPLYRCQQRTSLQHGQKDSGADVAWSVITGRLAGCKLDVEWWIRAVPMFGGNDWRGSFEGMIEPIEGTFEIAASFRGERHIIIVGRGREPVKTFAMDLIAGGKNDAGRVELSGVCPK